MGRLIRLILLLALLILALGFALINAKTIQINYYVGQITVPLSLALVVVLAVGALIGIFSSLGIIMRARRETAKLRKTVHNSEKEVTHLRSLPAKTER